MFTDDFFALAHDSDSCQPLLNSVALGLGLAAGLLCELVLDGRAGAADGLAFALPQAAIPPEPLQHRVYDMMRAEPAPLAVDEWLRYLAQDSREQVGDRLVRSRRYQRESARAGLLRRPITLYRPLHAGRAAYATVRLRNALRGPRVAVADVTVLALAVATELADHVLLWDEELSPNALPSLFRVLPHPLWEVITHTQATVAHHVLTQ